MPEFSILMPAYNYGRYLPEAIGSVLAQTFDDWELIIVDPASDDDTADILASFRDPRIHSLSTGREPLAATLNRALHAASGTWVSNLNADDRFVPQTLEHVLMMMSQHPTADVLGFYLRTIDARGDLLMDSSTEEWFNHPSDLNDPAAWIWHNHLVGAACVRRDALLSVGGYGSDLTPIVDWDLWVRLLAAGHRFEVLPEVLHEWRRHGSNITGSHARETVRCYALLSQRTLHPYLQGIGRGDLIAQNIAGFLGHAQVASDPQIRKDVLEKFWDSPHLGSAVGLVAAEVIRLREYHVDTDPKVLDLMSRLSAADERIHELEYERQALVDRLGSAELDRRRAQDELEAIRSNPVYRGARKARNLVRRKP